MSAYEHPPCEVCGGAVALNPGESRPHHRRRRACCAACGQELSLRVRRERYANDRAAVKLKQCPGCGDAIPLAGRWPSHYAKITYCDACSRNNVWQASASGRQTPRERAACMSVADRENLRQLATVLGRAVNLAHDLDVKPDWPAVVAEALGIVSGIKPGITDKTRRAG